MADRDKKSGVADIEILGWVGDVGEVVLAECFCDRIGVFRDALGVTGIWGENNEIMIYNRNKCDFILVF